MEDVSSLLFWREIFTASFLFLFLSPIQKLIRDYNIFAKKIWSKKSKYSLRFLASEDIGMLVEPESVQKSNLNTLYSYLRLPVADSEFFLEPPAFSLLTTPLTGSLVHYGLQMIHGGC